MGVSIRNFHKSFYCPLAAFAVFCGILLSVLFLVGPKKDEEKPMKSSHYNVLGLTNNKSASNQGGNETTILTNLEDFKTTKQPTVHPTLNYTNPITTLLGKHESTTLTTIKKSQTTTTVRPTTINTAQITTSSEVTETTTVTTNGTSGTTESTGTTSITTPITTSSEVTETTTVTTNGTLRTTESTGTTSIITLITSSLEVHETTTVTTNGTSGTTESTGTTSITTPITTSSEVTETTTVTTNGTSGTTESTGTTSITTPITTSLEVTETTTVTTNGTSGTTESTGTTSITTPITTSSEVTETTTVTTNGTSGTTESTGTTSITTPITTSLEVTETTTVTTNGTSGTTESTGTTSITTPITTSLEVTETTTVTTNGTSGTTESTGTTSITTPITTSSEVTETTTVTTNGTSGTTESTGTTSITTPITTFSEVTETTTVTTNGTSGTTESTGTTSITTPITTFSEVTETTTVTTNGTSGTTESTGTTSITTPITTFSEVTETTTVTTNGTSGTTESTGTTSITTAIATSSGVTDQNYSSTNGKSEPDHVNQTDPPAANTCSGVRCNSVKRISLILDIGKNENEEYYNYFCRHINTFSKNDDLIKNKLIYAMERTNIPVLNEFYRSCFVFETEEIVGVSAKVEDTINRLGGFGSNRTNDLTELLAYLIKRQTMPLFEIGMTLDQNSTLMLQITLPGKSHLPVGVKGWSALSAAKSTCLNKQILMSVDETRDFKELYSKYIKCVKETYLESIEKGLKKLGYFNLIYIVPRRNILEIKSKIEDLLNIAMPSSSSRSVQDLKLYLLDDLDQNFIFKFKKLFSSLTGKVSQPSTKIKIDKIILNLFQHLNTTYKNDNALLKDVLLSMYAADLFEHAAFIGQNSNRDRYQCLDLSRRLLPDLYAHLVETEFPDLYDVTKSTTYKLIKEQNIGDLELSTYSSKALDNTAYSNITSRTFGGMLRELMTLSQENYYKIEGEKINSQTLFSYFVDLLSLKPIKLVPNGFIAIPVGYQMLMKAANEELPDYLEISQIGFHLIREVVRYQKPNIMNFANYDLNYPVTAFNRPNIIVSSLSLDDIAGELSAYELTTTILENVKNDEIYNLGPQRSLTFDQLTTVATIQEYCVNMDLEDYMWEKYEDKTVSSLALSKKFIDVFAMNKNDLLDTVYN